MARFDIHKNPGADSRRIPFLLDVQSDLLSEVTMRVVVPLVRVAEFKKPAKRLHPTFEVEGQSVVMLTTHLAGIVKSDIGARVGSLAGKRDEIVAALDFLFQGF